jgi:hypothetical protein
MWLDIERPPELWLETVTSQSNGTVGVANELYTVRGLCTGPDSGGLSVFPRRRLSSLNGYVV